MALSYENFMPIGLSSGAKSRFEPANAEMQTNVSTFSHYRFHPYTNDVINRQRNTYESYFASGYYPEIHGNATLPSEKGNLLSDVEHTCIGGAYQTSNQQLYNGNQLTNNQWTFTPKSFQYLCQLNADTGTSLQNTSSAVGKDRSHPFYSRKRVEPAEGMTRTRDKYRVVYTEKQRRGLEKEYNANKFITTEIRSRISKELGLSARQIKIWFQNRRAKERRDRKKDKHTVQTEHCRNKNDNDANAYSPSGLDNTNEFLTSCRFTGNEILSEESQFSSRQYRFSNQTTNHGINTNCASYTTSSLGDCQNVRPSISPSEWRISAGSRFLPVNVSPLLGNVIFESELRI